ncbi:hypothetical protein V1477_020638 [Vespula maculifrons]|uniref:Uncharacterized protein n=1 Tax=Vespula maculifrons TaxID=7453 RepID=A0ABD2AMG6_VESMC
MYVDGGGSAEGRFYSALRLEFDLRLSSRMADAELAEIRLGSELSERYCRRSTGHSTFARFGIKLYSTECFDYSSYSSSVTNQTECQETNCFYTDIRALSIRHILSFFHEFYL